MIETFTVSAGKPIEEECVYQDDRKLCNIKHNGQTISKVHPIATIEAYASLQSAEYRGREGYTVKWLVWNDLKCTVKRYSSDDIGTITCVRVW